MTNPRIRHVWVKTAFSPVEHPGFVLAWERGETWRALVTYVVEADGRAITEWVDASLLRPVDSSPSIGSAYG